MAELRRTLRDPDSVKDFRIVSGPELVNGTTAGWNYEQAWLMCVELNAKNAYGGYTGITTYSFPMRFGSDSTLYIVSTINWISTDRRC